MVDNKIDNEPYIQTYTGLHFHFLNPRPEDICIEDITHALSNQCRFAGHTSRFYSVAEHSILVSMLVTRLGGDPVEGLLHDASEAYLMDMPSPIKREFSQYRDLETIVMTAIANRFSINYPFHDEVHEADNAQLIIEAENLLTKCDWIEQYRTTNMKGIRPVGLVPVVAGWEFLKAYVKLTGDTGEKYGT